MVQMRHFSHYERSSDPETSHLPKWPLREANQVIGCHLELRDLTVPKKKTGIEKYV